LRTVKNVLLPDLEDDEPMQKELLAQAKEYVKRRREQGGGKPGKKIPRLS
jgi:hypothetical protein